MTPLAGHTFPRHQPPELLYLSEVAPFPQPGGAIVIRRHLERLVADGWRVTAAVAPLVHGPLLATAPAFEVAMLPRRKWWWPPTVPSSELGARIRARLWARELRRSSIFKRNANAAVLTVLWGHLSTLAVRVARDAGVPLVVIVHDLLWEYEPTARRAARAQQLTRQIIASARQVFAVSEEMGTALRPLTSAPIAVLPPMPELAAAPANGWPTRFRTPPVVIHAGSFHPQHATMLIPLARALARRNGILLIVTAATNPALALLRSASVTFDLHPPLPSSADVLRFLAAEASALVIGYPPGGVPAGTIPTGFPSRLVEFAHLGLPILCVAPAENPLQTWACRHQWPLRVERADDAEFDQALDSLTQPDRWQALSAQMRRIAAIEFDPERIHRALRDSLTVRSAAVSP